ncbi:MAG: Nif3-like dinuclear metal center hexameric protein [Phycisphaerae bacterium]|nr:Nif3-like dinuclear metal center hexameric protein [Phycisphaerae bacterium]
MKVADLVSAMRTIAPPEYAEPWDRVGLLVGDAQRALSGPVLLTIDLTERVLDEAVAMKAGALVAYHPPIWEPLSRITAQSPRERLLLRAIEAGLAIYTPHTAVDASPGGMTDWLCEGLSGVEPGKEEKIRGDCRALRAHTTRPATSEVKLVTFVPVGSLDQLRQAMATAGAGIIGAYHVCSFATPGVGTFLGQPGTRPTVGEAGRLETASEHRLEMVCSRAALPLALETLRQFHPYEQPAIDVYELAPQPHRGVGSGRRLVVDKTVTLVELARRLKAWISTPERECTVRVATPAFDKSGLEQQVTHVGVCPGAGSEVAPLARDEGCQVFVTGEMKHHEVMAALHSGMSVVLAGHTNTERGYLPRLARRIEKELPGVKTAVSATDRDPLVRV